MILWENKHYLQNHAGSVLLSFSPCKIIFGERQERGWDVRLTEFKSCLCHFPAVSQTS